jgi:hypothetical protein
MIAFGLAIFIGVVAITLKMPRKLFLRVLNYPLTFDLLVAALVYALHAGSVTGIGAATFAAAFVHGYTWLMRWAWGYHDG